VRAIVDAVTVTDVHLVVAPVAGVPEHETAAVRDALAAHGVEARVVEWHDPAVDWAAASLTVVRTPWNYTQHLAEFRAWIDRVAAASTLWNPPVVLHWNLHKAYLLELHAAGAPIVPTVLLVEGSAASLDAVLDAQGWNEVVVKPAVSVGAIGAGRFAVGDPAGQAHLDAALQTGDVLVQQFVPSIETDGEVSLVAIDGDAIHAVRKRPAAGDYRIHPQYGGTAEPLAPAPALVELTGRLLEVVPGPTLYARVDVVSLHGSWHVMELEVLDPRLWLDTVPAALDRYVDAVIARLGMAR
jgi:glutathione synthase/RimK-type ligase-like ATP-grasp enzyme